MPELPTRLKNLDPSQAFEQEELERRFDLDELAIDRANAAKKRAKAQTLRAWQSDWKRWLAFCNSGCLDFPAYRNLPPEHRRRRPIPADPRLVRDFVAHNSAPLLTEDGEPDRTDKTPKSSRSLKPATLSRIVSTISKAHDLYGVPNPCKDSLVADTLATYSLRRRDQKFANPIRWEDILAFLRTTIPREVVLDNNPRHRAAKADLHPELRTMAHWKRACALLTMAYSSMLRREELIRIDMDHIQNADKVAELYVPYIKGGESDFRHVSSVALGAYRDWVRIADIREGPVFCQFQRNGLVPLRQKVERFSKRHQKMVSVYPATCLLEPFGKRMSGAEVNRVFKAAMSVIGKPPDFVAGVSGHSCRRGATMDLEESGATLKQIMTAAGWKTPTMPSRYTAGSGTRRGAMAVMAAKQKTRLDE